MLLMFPEDGDERHSSLVRTKDRVGQLTEAGLLWTYM